VQCFEPSSCCVTLRRLGTSTPQGKRSHARPRCVPRVSSCTVLYVCGPQERRYGDVSDVTVLFGRRPRGQAKAWRDCNQVYCIVSYDRPSLYPYNSIRAPPTRPTLEGVKRWCTCHVVTRSPPPPPHPNPRGQPPLSSYGFSFTHPTLASRNAIRLCAQISVMSLWTPSRDLWLLSLEN
jgi:hypothetical protein